MATAEEAEECISSEFNPVRAGFRGSPDVWTRDVLNLGVRPDRIIAQVRPNPMTLCKPVSDEVLCSCAARPHCAGAGIARNP